MAINNNKIRALLPLLSFCSDETVLQHSTVVMRQIRDESHVGDGDDDTAVAQDQ